MEQELFKLRERLFFKTSTADFSRVCVGLRSEYSKEMISAGKIRRQQIADIVAEISIDMQSYLTRWNLQNPNKLESLPQFKITGEAEKNYDFLEKWGFGDKISYIRHKVEVLRKSNLIKISKMTDKGIINNRLGNDSASGLTDAIRKGAVFVTTNPVMVNNVRKECPDIWDKVRNEIKGLHPDFSPEQLVSYFTMKVVLKNCIELRPIFEATDGNYGFVNLQISPRNFSNHELMTEEIEILYEELAKELNGLPNVVFKVPGTLEGMQTVKKVTGTGIRVTITASCAIDQHIKFAEIIEQGNSKTSFLVMMTGRFDDPVREELIGAGVSNAAEIAKYASAAIIRKTYDILYNQKGYKKSCILAASIRGPWNIENSITDGDVPILITCFPDKAVEYDSEKRDVLSHIKERIPDMIMDELLKSRIFRQGFEVNSMTANEFQAFYPVEATLNQFNKNYDEMIEYVSQ